MHLLEVILFLMLSAVALGWVARHFRFPYPIALVIGGGALGFVPELPQFAFDPQFILVLVLPPILYQAALLTSWRDFKANIRPISLLAVVAAGLVRGRYSPEIVSAEMRIIARSVWNLLVFLLNSLVFILIGTQLSEVSGRLAECASGQLFLYGALVSVVAIAVRFAWIYLATYLPLLLSEKARRLSPAPPEAEVFIMSWCGMRGIVSLAAALALPLALQNGEPFPQRDLIIFLTFVVIAVTLVVQGLTLAPLIRTFKVGTDWSGHEEEQRAKFALTKAALAASEKIPEPVAERIRAEFAEKVKLGIAAGEVLRGGSDPARRLRDAAIKAERRELIRIWRDNQISDDVLHHLEEDLDYQESRI